MGGGCPASFRETDYCYACRFCHFRGRLFNIGELGFGVGEAEVSMDGYMAGKRNVGLTNSAYGIIVPLGNQNTVFVGDKDNLY